MEFSVDGSVVAMVTAVVRGIVVEDTGDFSLVSVVDVSFDVVVMTGVVWSETTVMINSLLP